MNARLVGLASPVAQGLTFDRLLHTRAEPQNWLTYYWAYDGQRYSALDQINIQNLYRLKPAWVFQTSVVGLIATLAIYAFKATRIVIDGVIFMTAPDGYVWALDAATAKCCGSISMRYRSTCPSAAAM
jgi:alcohol dehydrogenase (cytochrome c)